MEHDWEVYVFKGAPAMKCKNCGFIWQTHMRVPRVSCDQIKNRVKKPKE